MSDRVKGQAAYVEEVDENGKTVRRTAKKPEDKKERPSNDRRSSRKGKEKSSPDSRREEANSSSTSSPPVRQVEPSKEERRKSSSSTKSPRKSSSRPPSVHKNATFPQPIDIPIRYAQPVLIQQPHMRALAQQAPRPSSFHEGMSYNYAPPLSSSAFYVPPNSLMPYPSSSPGGTFMNYGNGAAYQQSGGSVIPHPFRQDYFTPSPQAPARTLVERLGGSDLKARRRLSVYNTADDRGYESSREGTMPRKSSLRITKEQIDKELMPPPSPRRRESIRYAEKELIDDERYEPQSRPVYRVEQSPPRRRPSTKRHSATYTYGSSNDAASIEPERSGRRNSYYNATIEPERSSRRNSYYPPKTPSYPTAYDRHVPVNYNEKMSAAEKYQNSVGGPTVRLTAETLKRASRRAHPTSSHSTRSSGSRDESERQRSSVTTRTTGTNSGEEDITIKLKGQGKIKIAGAEIDYDKDTELNIRRGANVGGGGSQRSSEFGNSEERRDRRERASDRSRLSSNVRGSRERYYPGGIPGGMF